MALAREEDDKLGIPNNRYRQAYAQYGSVKNALAHGPPELAANVRADVADFKEQEKLRAENRAKLEPKIIDANAKIDQLENYLASPELREGMEQLNLKGVPTAGPPTTGQVIRGLGKTVETRVIGPLKKAGAGATTGGAKGATALAMVRNQTMKYIQTLANQLDGIPRITSAEIRGFGGPLDQLSENKLTYEQGMQLLANIWDQAEASRKILKDEYAEYMSKTARKRY